MRRGNRLSILAALVATTLTMGGSSAAVRDDAGRAWRRPAVERQRRVIFNNDGNDPITKIRRPDVQDMLDARTTALAGSHVDAIFYCTFSAGFGTFSHLTKVGQVLLTTEGVFEHNQMPAMLEKGIDPLTEMIRFAHANNIELFWSMRMNDTHDGGKVAQGPILFKQNKLKTAHPEYLLGKPFERMKAGAWSAVNYTVPEVRDLALAYVDEVCRNYDVDGVELDFFRHPVFFPSTARGERCTDAERAAMTGLVRRIREAADRAGRQRGRPILLAVRVPDSAEYARAIGLDVEAWMDEGLIDLVVVGGYFQLRDWQESARLGHRYGVKVYASLDESRVRDAEGVKARMTDAAYRARAANVWAAGMDGVYLFNQFDPKRPIWREIGDPALLRTLDKDFFASIRGVGRAAGGNLPLDSFQTVETFTPDKLRDLSSQTPATVRLDVADTTGRTTLRLRFDRATEPKAVRVALNDVPLADGRADGEWVEYAVTRESLRAGRNAVAIQLAPDAPATRWLDVMLRVRQPATR